MNVPVDADEDFLDEILGLLAIADRAVDEVQETRLVSLDQLLEGALFAAEKRGHDARVVLRLELLSYRGAW